LTRVYAPQPQEVELRLEKPPDIRARLWANGSPLTDFGPIPLWLTQGWNTLVVQIEESSPSSNVLFHPRVGFYLRLSSRATNFSK
jgi:hypothetical protein